MNNNYNNNNNNMTTQISTLANGCFWCSEAIFKMLKGVKSVLPGYSGGIVENPSYEQVCAGKTGHAESIQIEFDPTVIPYEKILDVFWHTHDPTTLNRQGNDVGT
ncbi:MAG TPA: peptide-methionine (S)-S-oxide reductase MsrA, partial [Nitrososphaeraceae archaeon]